MRTGEIVGPRGPIHYAFSGRLHAPVLVLLHPLGADLTVWEPVQADLERFFALLRIDLPGHGDSRPMVRSPEIVRSPGVARSSACCGVADLASEVLRVCDALNVMRAHVCGISLGGAIGLELALTHPQRVHRLVLANTAPCFPDTAAWEQRMASVRAEGMAPIIEAMPARWFTPEFRADRAADIEALAQRMRATEPQGYLDACEALKSFDCRERLAEIACSVLVIAGARDLVTPVEQTEGWFGQIPGADLAVLDAGHLAVMEQPGDFAALLIDFLRE
jgi:3-oxoadipate enol-lactonase